MSDQYGDQPSDQDRPGPYRGVFGGQPGAQPGPPQPGTGPYGSDRPGPYGGSFGSYGGSSGRQPNPYSYQPDQLPPPKQVTIASAISLGLGGLCILLGLFALTSAGEQIAETLTGSRGTQGLVVGVILVCAVAYILPGIFVRKRRRWARIMLIVVAAFGITGGVTALPSSILGLALHITLLVLMLQPPTKHWFQTPRP
jgi:hypothetical protein